jgi:DNA replication ATP-dependent helicase Dna2
MNTDSLLPLSAETSKGNRITNATEVTLLTQLAHLLLNAGIKPSDLGIVTFYRSQLALLRQSLRSLPDIELHTADKFQGRDKEVVFVSFVRNNEAGEVGELLKDWRRVNVAITRARSKLVLVGSRKTLLGGGEVLKGLVGICEERGWLWDLGNDVLENHWFPEMAGSQGTQIESPVKKGIVESIREKNGSPRKKVNELKTLRRPLGEIEGRNGQSPTKPKVPQKFGKIRADRILKSKPMLMDIMNDILGG